MAAATGNLFTDTFNSANPNSARVTVTRTAGAASLSCDNLAGWPTVSKVHFSTYSIDTNSKKVAGSQIDWQGIVSGNTIGSMTRLAGATDAGNTIGQIVEMMPTGSWGHDLYTGLTAQHNQDGTHAAITATSLVTTGAITEGAIPLASVRSETIFDHVASGCVWSGLGYGSTLTAAMTSGVVYIGGKRVTVASIATRTFTASKDTYVDVDNTGTITYTEVANNAASPSLAANSARLAIIVTGANIAAATSINQGQEDRVLPIASSIPYAVTDSLGNLICPRDPQRKILGYKQMLAVQNTTSLTQVLITPLSIPIIVPTGRKIEAYLYIPYGANSALSAYIELGIWEGAVGAGTRKAVASFKNAAAGQIAPIQASVMYTPSTSNITISGGFNAAGSGTATIDGLISGVEYPIYLIVKLV